MGGCWLPQARSVPPDRCGLPEPAKFSAFTICWDSLLRLRDFWMKTYETICNADLALRKETVSIAQAVAEIGSESQGRLSVAFLASIDLAVVIQRVQAL